MFTSSKIPNHLESVKFSGTEEKPVLQAAFYVTPVSYSLLYEVDDRIATHLFRREGKDHLPVAELAKTMLNLGDLGLHNLEIFPHDQAGGDDAGQLIAAGRITEVYCDKLFTDQPDWSLIWKVALPLDSHSLELARKYFKKTCFITLVKTQAELFEDDAHELTVSPDGDVESTLLIACGVCGTRAKYLGTDDSAWCGEHVRAAAGVHVRGIKYTGEAAVA